MEKKIYTAIGLMSGTSLDGIDAAIIETDGERIHRFGPWLTAEYDPALRARVRALFRGEEHVAEIEHELTLAHAYTVRALLEAAGMEPGQVDVIGFHGQTILHRPAVGITWQIGNGALLAAETGIDVVCDFRRMDVALGGQGAPLVPLFHAALAADVPGPVAILNIGGVGNVTWIADGGWRMTDGENLDTRHLPPGIRILAFDTGPGNALINDLAHAKTGMECDRDGKLARAGKVNRHMLAAWLEDPFFSVSAPKSLDRNHFNVSSIGALSVEDAAATLTAFTVVAVEKASAFFPAPVRCWYVCGGGRHNPVMMEMLAETLGDVKPCDELGWDGDAMEAQAFGYLAVRSLLGLPLSVPTTTGVSRSTTGGALYRKPAILPPS